MVGRQGNAPHLSSERELRGYSETRDTLFRGAAATFLWGATRQRFGMREYAEATELPYS
jgi:hypothetical protein